MTDVLNIAHVLGLFQNHKIFSIDIFASVVASYINVAVGEVYTIKYFTSPNATAFEICNYLVVDDNIHVTINTDLLFQFLYNIDTLNTHTKKNKSLKRSQNLLALFNAPVPTASDDTTLHYSKEFVINTKNIIKCCIVAHHLVQHIKSDVEACSNTPMSAPHTDSSYYIDIDKYNATNKDTLAICDITHT